MSLEAVLPWGLIKMLSAYVVLVIAGAVTGGRPVGSSLVSARAETCLDPIVEGLYLEPWDTGVTVSWTKLNQDCKGISRLIFVDWEATNGHGDQLSLPSNTEQYYINGLTPETTYTVTVFVEVTHGGKSYPAQETKAVTTTLKRRPTEPRNFSVVSVKRADVHVEWEPPLEPRFKVDGYSWDACRVDSCRPGPKAGCGFERDLGNVTSTVFSHLSPSSSYHFTLRAYTSNEGGRKMHSQPVSVCVGIPCAPEEKIHGLKVDPKQTSLTVSWTRLANRCPGRKNSMIRLSWQPAGGARQSRLLELSTNIFVINSLKPGTAVDIEVSVMYPDGTKEEMVSGSPVNATVSTLNGIPSSPREFAVSSLNSTSITVTWKAPAVPSGPLDGYVWDVCRLPSCTDAGRYPRGCTVQTPIGPTTGTTYSELEPRTSYLFFLYAYNVNEKSEKLLSFPVTLCTATGA